jgi:hypothetical protein
MKNKHFIGSAEFKSWEYCPKRWYFQQTMGIKINNPAVKRGMEHHRKRAMEVQQIQRTQSTLKTFIILGGIIWLIFLGSLLSQL